MKTKAKHPTAKGFNDEVNSGRTTNQNMPERRNIENGAERATVKEDMTQSQLITEKLQLLQWNSLKRTLEWSNYAYLSNMNETARRTLQNEYDRLGLMQRIIEEGVPYVA